MMPTGSSSESLQTTRRECAASLNILASSPRMMSLLDRDDIGARHHQIVEPPFAQAQDVAQHPALSSGEKPVSAALHRRAMTV